MMSAVLIAVLVATLGHPNMPAQAIHTATAPSPAALEIFQRGTEALRAGRPGDAAALFQQVVVASPRFAEAFLNLGLALAQQGKDADATQALEHGIMLKPGMRGAHLFLAISDYRLGHLDSAAATIRKETEASPSDAQVWMWQGIIDLANGKLSTSVDDLDRAATLDPKSVDILYHRGRAALALSRASYEQMFQLDPQSWHVHQVLAEADVESGNDGDAIDQFKQAIAGAPPQGGLYEALGSSYWRTGHYDEAQQAYRTGLQLEPGDTLTRYKLGCLLVDRSQATEGKALLQQVAVADSSLAMTTYYLGRAEAQLGDDGAAIQDFQTTIHNHLDEETTKQAWFQLSRIYRRQHNTVASDEAQAQYRLLDQRSKEVLQAKLDRRRARADRDASIPASQDDRAPEVPASQQ